MIRIIVFFMASLVAVGGTSMAEDLSTCSADTVPIQIIDRNKDGPMTSLSDAIRSPSYDESEPPLSGPGWQSSVVSFNTFVEAVTKHLAIKLGEENLCLNSAESKERSVVQFAHLYLSLGEDEHILSALQPLAAQPSGGCRISSPWIDIVVEREPVPSVRAIIRFNERQFLVDQAVMAGERGLPQGVARPLTGGESNLYFNAYAREYSTDYIYPHGKPKRKPIKELVPPDILWLLDRRHDPEVTVHVFVMARVLAEATESYTKIVLALIDQCFASDGANIQYNNILDVGDLINLEEYKIKWPVAERNRSDSEQ